VTVLNCRFEDGLAFLDRDLPAVYRERDGIHIGQIISLKSA
jgi:hypothetical protein